MHAPEIDGTVLINDAPDAIVLREGDFHRCRVTKAHDYDLQVSIL